MIWIFLPASSPVFWVYSHGSVLLNPLRATLFATVLWNLQMQTSWLLKPGDLRACHLGECCKKWGTRCVQNIFQGNNGNLVLLLEQGKGRRCEKCPPASLVSENIAANSQMHARLEDQLVSLSLSEEIAQSVALHSVCVRQEKKQGAS